MSKNLRLALHCLTCLLAAAVFSSVAAAAGIVGSKHDLTSTGTGSYTTTGTNEVCVFCHTPHGASSAAPLWNRVGATAPGGFQLYSSATIDSTILAVGSNSLACLSCHDGATALDMLINGPGSGAYNPAGALQGWTFTTGQTMAGTGITNLGTDLGNDHPIGVAYCSGFPAAGACKDPDFKLAALNKNVGGTITTGTGAATTTSNLTDQFWIDTSVGTSGAREKTDVILYVRAFANPAGNFPSVECASCHEPHNGTGQATFLRISNASSALCTTCHNK